MTHVKNGTLAHLIQYETGHEIMKSTGFGPLFGAFSCDRR